MEINILALGDRFSAAYTSLEHELKKHGKIFYHSEHDFKNAGDAIKFIRNSSFDVVIMPNPYGNKRRMYIYKQLKVLNFPVVIFDRGALPDSWFFDIGFNADSPSFHPLEWDIQLSKEENSSVSQYIEKFKVECNTLEKQNMPIGSDALREKLNIGDKRVLFVPFQRPEDTVIKYFSDGYNKFVNEIENVTKYVKKHLSNEWVVLAKKHPLETKNPSKLITFVDEDVNIYDLIDLSEKVVLINSGVGVLSMLWNKPVLYFGEVFYGHPDINLKVNDYKDVLYYMNKEIIVNELAVKKFIYHLRYKVYSFANFETEEVLQKDGNYRNITRYIDFYEVRFPNLEKMIKKKVLFITQVIPWPINRGSAQRTDQMLRAFIENNFDIDVIVSNISERGISSNDIKKRLELEYKGINFIVRKHPSILNKSKKKKDKRKYLFYKLTQLIDILKLDIFRISNFRLMPFNIRNLLKKQLQKKDYDVVYSNYLYNVPSFFQNRNFELICDTHDLQFRRIENDVIPFVSPIKAFLYKMFFKKSELKRLGFVDKIISISPVETKIMKNLLPNKQVFTIPATAETPNIANTVEEKYDCTFIGSNSDANRDSLLWFLDNCLTLLINERKDLKFLIQGRITRNKLIQKNKIFQQYLGRNIISKDFVEDLSNVYNDSKIIICPIIKGSGMKIKVIEALSYGKAIIGTDVAFEGINIQNEAVRANSSIEFIQGILDVLNDNNLKKGLEQKSLKFFKQEHSFEKCVSEIKKVVGSIL